MALPRVIGDLVELIGHGKTMELVREFGGQAMRIPKTDASDTWAALAEVIGEKATRTLAATFGDEGEIYIAKCAGALRAERNRAIVARADALLAEGHSSRGATSVLVRETGLCYRQLEKIINGPAPEAGQDMVTQGSLF